MKPSRAGTFAKGIGALAALLIALVGVPILLHAVAGSPIPNAPPALDQVWAKLTARDDGTLLLGLLKYAAWAGWALFAVSVLADVATRMRGVPTPRLGPLQQLATHLVGAVLALAVSIPTALPAGAMPQNPAVSEIKAAAPQVIAETTGPHAARSGPALDSQDEIGFDEYRVRKGDCLWDVAWNELGEPERWPEIYEASRSVRQPDGRRLTDPDLIVTGWVLHIPVHAEPLPGPRASVDPDPVAAPPVVTPLRSGLRSTRPSLPASPGKGGAHTQVRTALSTDFDEPVNSASALEMTWQLALARHGSTNTSGRTWRDRLGPGSS